MFNFLGLPPELTCYANAKYVVLPIPYDGTTSYRGGTKLGPNAIIDASMQVEFFDQELLVDVSSAGIHTADAVHPPVSGPADVVAEVERTCKPFVADGKFILGLGGEHSVTTGIVKALLKSARFKKAKDAPFGVLQIDAHADLRADYEGSPYSHASIMRRMHQDLHLPIAQVGIRSFSQPEHNYAKANKLEFFTPAVVNADPAGWIDRVLARLPERVFITVDIDGFDPAFAPGTGTPEPGGLNWHQVTGLLRKTAETREVVGADIVEVTPIGGQHVTEFLAARLGYKLITYAEAAGRKLGRRG